MIQILSFNPLLKHSKIQMGFQRGCFPDAGLEPHCPGASVQIAVGIMDVHGNQKTGAKWARAALCRQTYME